MRAKLSLFFTFQIFIWILSSCSLKNQPIEPPKTKPKPINPPTLHAQLIKEGCYSFLTSNVQPDIYSLVIRNEVRHLEDRQDVIITAEGNLALVIQPDKNLTVNFTPKLIGEPFDIYLTTLAGKSLDCIHVVPFPVVDVTENGYAVVGEILNSSADFFFFQATGFLPLEEVILIAGSNGLGQTIKLTANEEGNIYFIQNPASQGGRKGNGYIYLLGKNGGIEVKYPWGTNLIDYSKAFFQIETDSNY